MPGLGYRPNIGRATGLRRRAGVVLPPVAAFRQLATSRSGLLRFEGGLNPNPTNATVSDSRIKYTSREAINGFQFTSVGSTVPTNGSEGSLGVSHTVKGFIEYPSGVLTPITWSGADSKTVSSGGEVKSDIIDLPSPIPAQTDYWIWTRVTGSEFVMPVGLLKASEDLVQSYSSAPPVFGAAPPAGSGHMPGFAAITANHSVQRATYALMGDSNVVPQQLGSIRDAAGVGGFSTSFTNMGTVDHVKLASSGAPHTGNNYDKRISFMVSHGVTRAMILLGTNNLSGTTDNSAELIGFDEAMATALNNAGIIPHFMTLPPKKNSGVPQGETARLALNASRRSRSGTGIYGVHYDLADQCETARDSGDWKPGYTNGDDLHIKWDGTGGAEVIASFRAWAVAL